MHKFLSLAILLLLAACEVPTPAAPTQQHPILTFTVEQSPTTVPPTVTPTATPEPTQSPTETPPPSPTLEQTPAPLMTFDVIGPLTLFDKNSGWARWSRLTPLEEWPGYGSQYSADRWFIRAVDGLESWQSVTPLVEEYESLRIAFVDQNTAVAVYYRSSMPESAGTEIITIRTADGGHTWQQGEVLQFDCCLRNPSQIKMLDANRGWMMATDHGSMGSASLAFFKTSDGGLHWEMVYDTNEQVNIDWQKAMFAGSNPFGNYGFVLLDFDNAFFATGYFYRTENGGTSWEQVVLPIPPAETDEQTQAGMGQYQPPVSVPQFWSQQEGVTVGRYYKDLMIPPGQPTSLPVAEFLYFTSDGGLTWNYRPSPAKIGNPFFLDSQTGWYLGKSDSDPTVLTSLYLTTNGGENWEQISADTPLPLGAEMTFFDAETGYAEVPDSGYDYLFDVRSGKALPYFFFTRDGGRTWEQITPEIVP